MSVKPVGSSGLDLGRPAGEVAKWSTVSGSRDASEGDRLAVVQALDLRQFSP